MTPSTIATNRAGCIPTGAPHPENAHAFLNHIHDAEVNADIANTTNYPTSNDDMARMFSLFSLQGWEVFGANWEALDARMKTTIARTTEG